MNEQNLFWSRLFKELPEIAGFYSETQKDVLPPDVSDKITGFLDLLTGQRDRAADEGSFLVQAARRMQEEWSTASASSFREKAQKFIKRNQISRDDILDLFFPEYRYGGATSEEQIQSLRKRRTVTVQFLNPQPLKDPSKELIFTSNVLLTLPPERYMDRLDNELRVKTDSISKEKQKYWFDHPILMGVDRDSNEMIYGLKGLAESFRFEKDAGIVPSNSRMTIILSLSVTHDGLKGVAQEYLSRELEGVEGLEDLDVFLFTEEDTQVITRSLKSLSGSDDRHALMDAVFGVDGRYGRHYSFLKAIVPLWSLTVDPEKKGTFKIDLDQVFPQKELKKETGRTAFEHFMTPLWGALGTDFKGRDVELGMIAGALVNEKDIVKSVFTPDVPMPSESNTLTGENRIFFKQYPMALSTLAEMMTTYKGGQMPDGHRTCLSRVHVTGGTNGILNSVVRKKRPFTPSFIGRAEDQAYLLSVLMDEDVPVMRYIHEPGLIMRHDKEAFAGDSIEASKLGTWVADLLRILYFSYYAAFLPGGVGQVKEELDPFTGCFITSTPMIKIFLRLILKILEQPSDARMLLDLAETQLSPFVLGTESSETVKTSWAEEREGWDQYYDALDILEEGLKAGDQKVMETVEDLKKTLLKTRIK